MEDLKKCPFCGGEAEVIKAHQIIKIPYVVICNNEKCRANVGVFQKTKEEAIAVWNKRVE